MKSSDKQNSDQNESGPWYTYGIVWLFIGLLTSVVIASLVTVVIAFKNKPILIDTTPTKTAVSQADNRVKSQTLLDLHAGKPLDSNVRVAVNNSKG